MEGKSEFDGLVIEESIPVQTEGNEFVRFVKGESIPKELDILQSICKVANETYSKLYLPFYSVLQSIESSINKVIIVGAVSIKLKDSGEFLHEGEIDWLFKLEIKVAEAFLEDEQLRLQVLEYVRDRIFNHVLRSGIRNLIINLNRAQ